MLDSGRKTSLQQANPSAQDKSSMAAKIVKKDKMKHFLAQRQRNAIWVAAIIAILMVILYLCGALNGVDSWISDAIISLRFNEATLFFKQLTLYLNLYVLALVVTIIAAFGPGRHPALSLTLNTAAAFLLNEVLKVLFARERPVGSRLITETGYSFPSGHSLLAMVFFGFIIWLIWQALRDRTVWKWFLTIIFAFIIFSVGFSRVYLGVHWMSDVIEGWAVGFLWLMFFIKKCAPRLQNSEVVLKTTAFYQPQGQEGAHINRRSNHQDPTFKTNRADAGVQKNGQYVDASTKHPSGAVPMNHPSATVSTNRPLTDSQTNTPRK